MVSNRFRILLIALIVLLISLVLWIMTWRSPDVNLLSEWNINTCIDGDTRKLHFKLGAKPRKHFEIDLIENSKPGCLNPYFPSIRIQTNDEHNAWVHIVSTDSKVPQWKMFIDAENKDIPHSVYPFYTYEQDFFDAPLWTYSLLSKPFNVWKGHAFAVKVDHKNKAIICIGGIEWGFELSFIRLRPKAIHPQLLDENAWGQAWQVLQNTLPGYKQTYEGKL